MLMGTWKSAGERCLSLTARVPVIMTYDDVEDGSVAIGEWLRDKHGNSVMPQEMGIFV